MSRIKVLIVDDSALVRQMLSDLISEDPDFEVVGTAPDPFVARDKIKVLHPDVLTLDVEMPRMDGLKFLENLMRLRPMPVVMVSSLTQKGAEITLQALELGAIDFVAKPTVGVSEGLAGSAVELREKLRVAARSNPRVREQDAVQKPRPPLGLRFATTDRLIAIGASTGGTEAIRAVLQQLSADCPAVVIAQHIPPAFSQPFAERLNRHSALAVSEAEDGQEIRPGHAYVAPGDDHLEVRRSGARWVCQVSRTPPVNRHRPSVDVLFNSVAENCGANASGFLLTGMGMDGARGLLAMREAGCFTLAQDEASSVVWGMPGAAVKLDAALRVAALKEVPEWIERFAREGSRLTAACR